MRHRWSFVADTTRYADPCRGVAPVAHLVEQAETLVLQHSLVLCARDRHFDHLPQVTRA